MLDLALLALLIVVGVPLFLYLMQEKMIFHPQPLAPAERERLSARPGVEPIELAVGQGASVHGWLVKGGTLGPKPLLIYFGGNAEEVSWLIDDAARLSGWTTALMNYRGFGFSTGKPTQDALFADALAVHDHLVRHAGIVPTHVAVMGRSLGSGVAVYLAAERDIKAVVLVSPYDSVRNIASSRYPFVPVDWLLKHPFDSIGRAPGIVTPALMLVAERDAVIEPFRSRLLGKAWGGPVDVREVPGADHNSISRAAGYWPAIEEFLSRFRP